MINSLITPHTLDPIVLALVSSFVLIIVLLLSLNFKSNWRWEIKAFVIDTQPYRNPKGIGTVSTPVLAAPVTARCSLSVYSYTPGNSEILEL